MTQETLHDKKQYAQSPNTGIFTIYQPGKVRRTPPCYDEATCNFLGEIARRMKNDFVLYCWIYDNKDASDEGCYCEVVPDITSLMHTEETDNREEMEDLAHRAINQCLGDHIDPDNEPLLRKLRRDLEEKLIVWVAEVKERNATLDINN